MLGIVLVSRAGLLTGSRGAFCFAFAPTNLCHQPSQLLARLTLLVKVKTELVHPVHQPTEGNALAVLHPVPNQHARFHAEQMLPPGRNLTVPFAAIVKVL